MKRAKGFTIVEIAVVIVILGILVSLTVVTFMRAQASARDSERKADALMIKAAISRYISDNGEAPWPASGYTKGNGYDLSIVASQLVPKYLQAIPTPPKPTTNAFYYYTVDPTYPDSWSIEVINETSTHCQVGNKIYAGWWASAPNCPYN